MDLVIDPYFFNEGVLIEKFAQMTLGRKKNVIVSRISCEKVDDFWKLIDFLSILFSISIFKQSFMKLFAVDILPCLFLHLKPRVFILWFSANVKCI